MIGLHYPSRRGVVLVLLLLAGAVLALRAPAPAGAETQRIIVSVGDSFGSGQGAPDSPGQIGQRPAEWQDIGCFRSNKAGAPLAHAQLNTRHPGTAFLHVACNGATITNGLLGDQQLSNGQTRPAQLRRVKEWMTANYPGRPIDALIISIGGNDVGFYPTILQCLADNPLWPIAVPIGGLINPPFPPITDDCSNHTAFTSDLVNGKLPALDGLYGQLNQAIQNLGMPVRNVYLQEYPNPLYKAPAILCGNEPTGDLMYNISRAEASWATRTLFQDPGGLIDRMRAAARRYGWRTIETFNNNNGYCATEPWINTVNASLATQADVNGAVHPNARGYEIFRDKLTTALQFLWGTPAAPSNFRVGAVTDTTNTLRWTDAAVSEDYYELQETPVGGTARTLRLPMNSTAATQTDLAPGSARDYRLRACSADANYGCSAWSPVLRVTQTGITPPANLHVMLKRTLDDLYQLLLWEDRSANETYFEIVYWPVGGTTRSTIRLAANTTAVRVDTTFPPGQYDVFVRACNATACSDPTNTVRIDPF